MGLRTIGYESGGAERIYRVRRNVQGDVEKLVDVSGTVVVEYVYDAWGNHTVRDTSGEGLGTLNSIRYRGYIYDTETGLYYLQSRYYDPEVGRFLSADSIEYLDPETINGLNLYAYCNNNPVMYVDPTGHAPKWWQWLIGSIGIALIGVAAGLAILGTGGVAAFGLGALIGSVSVGVLGAGIGAGIGYAVGGMDGLWQGALIGFGIGAAVGFAIGGAIGASAYSSALGTNFGKMGTVVEHPGIKVDWSKSMIHGPERMLQRGVTKRVVNSTVRRGIALSQAGGKFAFITQKAVAVVSSSGVFITTYGKAFYDAGMLEIIKVLFGG